MPREQVLAICTLGGQTVAKRRGWMSKIGKIGGERSGEVKQQRKLALLDKKVKKLEKHHKDVT